MERYFLDDAINVPDSVVFVWGGTISWLCHYRQCWRLINTDYYRYGRTDSASRRYAAHCQI